jgi:protein gp37
VPTDRPSFDLDRIGWGVVFGEFGARARPMDPTWARHVREVGLARRIPFFFKQWGPSRLGRALDGNIWGERPDRPDGLPLSR